MSGHGLEARIAAALDVLFAVAETCDAERVRDAIYLWEDLRYEADDDPDSVELFGAGIRAALEAAAARSGGRAVCILALEYPTRNVRARWTFPETGAEEDDAELVRARVAQALSGFPADCVATK